MTHDLLTQLAEYGTYSDARQGAVSADDVTDAVMPIPMPTQRTRPRQGWLIAAAAAAVVLVLLGGLALLEPFATDGVAPADEPAVTTIPTPATTTVTTLQPTTTVVPDTTTVSSAPSLLDVALARESVTSWYGEEVKVALVYIDAYLKGMSGSPIPSEPRFDATTLGIESVLIEINRSALASLGSYAANDREPIVEHPFLAGVQLAGTTEAAAYRIDIGFDGDVVTPNWSLAYTSAYTGDAWPEFADPEQFYPVGFTQGDSFVDYPPANIILVFSTGQGQHPVVIGGLPADAAVVVTTFDDGTKVWQRPVAGIAMFLDPNRQCEDHNGTGPSCEGEFIVLDADGSEIFTIVLTPPIQDNTKRDFGFRIDTP